MKLTKRTFFSVIISISRKYKGEQMERDQNTAGVLGSFYTYLFTAFTFIGIVCSVYLTQI